MTDNLIKDNEVEHPIVDESSQTDTEHSDSLNELDIEIVEEEEEEVEVVVDESSQTDTYPAQVPGPVSDTEHDDLESPETGRGRPPHLPNEDTRKQVYDLSSVGTTYEDIAKVLGISHDTLVKYYRPELDRGRIDANAIIAGTLFKEAQSGNTSAMIFWLKTRARWKEVTQHEISGNPDGSPVQVKVITGIE